MWFIGHLLVKISLQVIGRRETMNDPFSLGLSKRKVKCLLRGSKVRLLNHGQFESTRDRSFDAGSVKLRIALCRMRVTGGEECSSGFHRIVHRCTNTDALVIEIPTRWHGWNRVHSGV